MESALVIKVKYGDTLRRFSAPVNDNGLLDFDMSRLRAKILGLFNLPFDADLTLTYVDEDGDVVTFVDDNDLLDVMRQKLKFLRVNVHLNSDFGKTDAKFSGDSTPMRSPHGLIQLPDINNAVADALKSVPEPVREAISKLSHDLASKAAYSNCVVAELTDCFSKMGQSILNLSQHSQVGASSSTQSVCKEIPKSSAPAIPNATKDKTGMENRENVTGKSVPAPVDLNMDSSKSLYFGNNLFLDDKKETKIQSGHLNKKPIGFSMTFGINESPMSFSSNNECPFSVRVASDSSAPPFVHLPVHRISPIRRGCDHNNSTVGMFHRGVQCDGCGAHPIIGPRYKSKVIDDYDLCSICFSQMGNETDYIKMDRPVSYGHPHSLKNYWNARPPLAAAIRHHGMKASRSNKLDSRFILDMNVLDGTIMAPCTHFTKIWRMRNSGRVPWPQGAQLVWIGGDRFSHEVSAKLEIPVDGVPVDGELDVAVDFTSPELPGQYISYWRMASPSGTKFGQRIWVLIQVDASVKDLNSDGGFNLNLPPESSSTCPQIIDVKFQPATDSGLMEPGYSTSVSELETGVDAKQSEKEQEMNFPINDTLLVGEGAPTRGSSSVSYPIIDFSEALEVTDGGTSSENGKEKWTVENSLLKELEEMGFKQVDLNKEVLRLNEYNLEQSVDDLCGVSEWDPILEELQEMGFCDEEKNKKLLKKNNGSIRRVVMDLVSDEKA